MIAPVPQQPDRERLDAMPLSVQLDFRDIVEAETHSRYRAMIKLAGPVDIEVPHRARLLAATVGKMWRTAVRPA